MTSNTTTGPPLDPRLAFDPADPELGGNVIGGDRHTYHPALWRFLLTRYPIRSMLDVGCAEGHCVRWFRTQGVKAAGFDGLQANVDRSVAEVSVHDLRDGPFTMPVDLVHCCEVVEHVAEAHLPNVLTTLGNGRVIAMTHAVPGQGGHNHVNCQPVEYWIERVEAMGYTYAVEETKMARTLGRSDGAWTYFERTGLIFERRGGFVAG